MEGLCRETWGCLGILFLGGLYPHFFSLVVIIRVIILFLVIVVIHYFVSNIFYHYVCRLGCNSGL